MVRFFSKLALLILLSAVLICVTVWVCIAYETLTVDRVYNVDSEADVLFIGSSQIGCSISEKKEFHNFVLWNSRRTHYSFLARLLELEHRNKLDQFKVCVVYFNPLIIRMQTPEMVNRSWWSDFYLGHGISRLYPTSLWEKFAWGCSNLSVPMGFSVSEKAPGDRKSIASHDKTWKDSFYDEITNKTSALTFDQLVPNWEAETRSCYKRIIEICRRHEIRCVILDFPMLGAFRNTFQPCYFEKHREIFDWLKLQGAECVTFDKEYGEDFYFDHVHMIESMAEVYTRDLYEKLGIPIFKETP